MEQYEVSPIKYVVIGLLILGIFLALVFIPLTSGQAQNRTQTSGQNTQSPLFGDAIAANTLCNAGLQECSSTTSTSTAATNSAPSLFGGLLGGSSGPRFDPIISIVNVPGQKAVYRIINGQKHSIPTTEVFYSYGFNANMIQEISQSELNKYPLARLFIIEGIEGDKNNPQIYYLTEGGMLRPILNDKVFYSYGDRKEDVISINQKEFNYYPRNEFIYLERPKLDRDIYQITGGIKRYLTPVAVKRMNLKEREIAPVNQIEFDEYPEGEPVIF